MKVKDAAGNLQKATVDDLIKIVEDLTRIHWARKKQKKREKFPSAKVDQTILSF
jgi:hypothetical protein